MTNVSSKYLIHNQGVVAALRAFLSKCSIYELATMGLTRDPFRLPPLPVHGTGLERRNMYYVGRTLITLLFSTLIIQFYCAKGCPVPVDPV